MRLGTRNFQKALANELRMKGTTQQEEDIVDPHVDSGGLGFGVGRLTRHSGRYHTEFPVKVVPLPFLPTMLEAGHQLRH